MSAVAADRYLGIQSRGILALPIDLRRRHRLDQPGAQVKIVERSDGVIELHPALPIPADQQWFWTQRWQEREREVDALVARGQVQVHDSAEAFLSHLDSLSGE